ncbi:ROK family transcriptional regulator [Aureimonas leprariae]
MADATSPTGLDERLRGSNQSNLRAHNERAVLSLIRQEGVLAKAEIARRTGLSPQTASVIMRALEAEELVLRDAPQRGRVGQPSVPMRLNPDGAFSLGLKVGRRSADIVLMDFVGTVRAHARRAYDYPAVAEVAAFLRASFAEFRDGLAPRHRSRLAGLGIAMPSEIWNWEREVAAPHGAMDAWRSVDMAALASDIAGLPAFLANDATAACAAELVFGASPSADFIYVFVGAFVGGGIVINNSLVAGRLGNAGALGSMLVADGAGGSRQLINAASIHVLEKMMRDEGRDPRALWAEEGVWPDDLGSLLDRWLALAAGGIAHAVASACAVYDFDCAVIDGSLPAPVRDRLVAETKAALRRLDLEGLSPATVRTGTIGLNARETGAASLPFFAKYLLDHRVLYAERG